MPFNDPELDRLGETRRSLKVQCEAYRAEMDRIFQEIQWVKRSLSDFHEQVAGLKEGISFFKERKREAQRVRAWEDANEYGRGIDRNYSELDDLYARRRRLRELWELHNEVKEKRREAATAYREVNEDFR